MHNSITASLSLSHEELAFAYSAFDLLIPALRKEYPNQAMIEPIMFKGFISGQLQKAKTLQPFEGSRSAAPQVQYPPGQEGANNTGPVQNDPLLRQADTDNKATEADRAAESGRRPVSPFGFGGQFDTETGRFDNKKTNVVTPQKTKKTQTALQRNVERAKIAEKSARNLFH